LEARRHHDVCARLGSIACATFVGAGRFDGIAPPANSEAIVARIPNSELHVYEGGHLFVAQDPAAFADVLDFLAGRRSSVVVGPLECTARRVGSLEA
jgi:3-oxoadipate enol-lactonase